ncbi:single-stranded DNA-binding protein [Bacteroidetes/Chlorobi group bacterium MS-B_bin-24]|jgi:single-strand DNA-binding protein|nr:MAG: single-stranded DNA-binding protein [Bacteroidetes/Chlorobi group bacterium MS-B_bin-24]
MPFSMNKVIIIGNLGADPEFRTTPQGVNVCRFRVATTERYRDRSGNWQDDTEWHNVVVFGPLAETASRMLKRGSKVCVEGRNKTRHYEKNGETHYITEVIARSIVYLDPKSERQTTESASVVNDYVDTTSYYLSDIQDVDSEPSNPIDAENLEEDDLPF